MRYPIGQPVRVTTTVRDTAGALVTPGTITLSLLKPNAVTVPYTPVADSTGVYHYDIPAADLTAVGPYQYKFVTTGAGAGAVGGSFSVYDLFTAEVLSLDDAKAQLNITTSTMDGEIQSYVDAVTEMVEDYAGPIAQSTYTEIVTGSEMLVLRHIPVVSVTSVTNMFYPTLTYTASSVDLKAGVLWFAPATALPWGTYSVVYVAGRAEVPAAVNLAARIIVQHLWLTQRGAMLTRGTSADDVGGVTPGFGFAVPNRALELLRPFRAPTAVA